MMGGERSRFSDIELAWVVRVDSLQHSVLVEGHRSHIMGIIVVMVQ